METLIRKAMKRRNAIAIATIGFILVFFAHLQSGERSIISSRTSLNPEGEFANNINDFLPEDVDSDMSDGDDSKWPRKNGKRISQIIADEKIAALQKQLGSGRGPLIVGGIGDSGTRGFWDVMMKLGVYMQGQDNVRGDSRDSLKFMSSRVTTQSDGSKLARSPSALYNEPISRSRSIKYNSSHVRPERWQCGRQYIADMIQEIVNDTIVRKTEKGKSEPLYPFGFKHPRTALLLPYFYATLGGKFAFIHVLRDGREVAAGDNNYLFMDHCRPYYGVGRCDDSRAIEMWADLNREVFEYALESDMAANQYFAMRVEDLVQGQSSCYENLVKFLGVPSGNPGFNLTERIQLAMKSSMSHSKSYFGQKYTYNERQNMLNVRSKTAKEALNFWGYSGEKFGLRTDCTDMPWMVEFRRKKGKLPTDS